MGDVRAVTARFPQIYGVTKSTHGLSEFLENSTHNLDPVYGGNEKIHPIYGGAALNRLIAVSPFEKPPSRNLPQREILPLALGIAGR
jgi:hypothetical protein